MSKEKPVISLIVAALLPKYGIGYEGQLPWRLKREMRYFRQVTSTASSGKQNAVIMGRKTWLSIPPKFRPLPDRINIVLSRSGVLEAADGVVVADSVRAAVSKLDHANIDQIFVIGGAELYSELLQAPESADYDVKRVFLTEITTQLDVPMDAFINVDPAVWERQSSEALSTYLAKYGLSEQLENNEEGDYKYSFTLWERNSLHDHQAI